MGLREQDLKTLLTSNVAAYFYLLVQAYERRLYAYVWCLLCHRQDTEDIVQDTFVNAYRALRGFSWSQIEELKLERWLFTIARNLSRNYQSRRGIRHSQLISLDQLREHELLDGGTDGAYSSPEMELEKKESYEELYACIGELSEAYRETVILHYIAKLSYPEVAMILGQPLNTVKSNGYRGFKQLQEIVKGLHYVKEEVKEHYAR